MWLSLKRGSLHRRSAPAPENAERNEILAKQEEGMDSIALLPTIVRAASDCIERRRAFDRSALAPPTLSSEVVRIQTGLATPALENEEGALQSARQR
jgi:hypothetical protein